MPNDCGFGANLVARSRAIVGPGPLSYLQERHINAASNAAWRRREEFLDRFTRENNQREHAEDRSERHKKALNTRDHEREHIPSAVGQRAAGDQNAKGHDQAEQKEKGPQPDENPTQKFGRRFSGLLGIGMLRRPDEKCAHAGVKQWEKGKERS